MKQSTRIRSQQIFSMMRSGKTPKEIRQSLFEQGQSLTVWAIYKIIERSRPKMSNPFTSK